jgi:ABC-type multidrug transport system fused ATPase/permease subunit
MVTSLLKIYQTPIRAISKNDNSQQFKILKLHNVSFNISGMKIIENLNFELKRGSSVAVFGKSGSGKSTLIDIFLGLIKPTSGKIMAIKKNLRINNGIINFCSYLSESPFLLNTTIKDNIILGNINQISDVEAIINSLKISGLDEFANYQSLSIVVGNKGNKLSLGQRQRLCLARAIYANKDILVLDEATNAVDLKTDIAITKRLISLKNKTIITVTHRAEVAKLFKQKLRLD